VIFSLFILYGGIDGHSNNRVLALIDEQNRMVYCKRLPNKEAAVLAALAPYRKAFVGLVVKSTYNWSWLVGALMAAEYCVHLTDTTALLKL
jgi:transposase